VYPTIGLDPTELCRFERDMEGRNRIVGQVHVFDWRALARAAGEAETGIDQHLCAATAAALVPRPPKTPFIIFWRAAADHVHLTISSPNTSQQGSWFFAMGAHVESGRDYVHPHAVPWAVWDGRALTRVHREPERDFGDPPEDAGDERYLVDLGGYPGPVVVAVDGERWEAVGCDPAAEPDYRALPAAPEERLRIGAREYTLRHAWWR
jgi:hypothetical protein